MKFLFPNKIINIICCSFLCVGCYKRTSEFSHPLTGKPHSVNQPKYIEVYGHRGARSYSPENTIPGTSTALKVGINWLDMDIAYTKDKQIIVYHDLYLNPNFVQNEQGKYVTEKTPIYQLTYSDLKKYDVGKMKPDSEYSKYFPNQVPVKNTHIPLLKEVIDYTNKQSNKTVNFQIEIKTDPNHPDWAPSPEQYAKDLYKILKESNIVEKVEVHAFDWKYLYALQKLDKNIKTGYLVGHTEIKKMRNSDPKIAGLWTGGKLLKDYNHSLPQMIKSLGGCCYDPEDVALTQTDLEEAHKLGLKVVVWTWPEHIGTAFDINVVKKMIDWNVDGIITDDPGQLNSMLAARNYPIPQNFSAGYKK